jgi:hypothetical protein
MLIDFKDRNKLKENAITMKINTTKIKVHVKEYKHWKSASVITW